MKQLLMFVVILLFASITLPVYAQEYGTIKVLPPTEDCEIIIDGIQVGTGTTTTKIIEGMHNVVVNLKDEPHFTMNRLQSLQRKFPLLRYLMNSRQKIIHLLRKMFQIRKKEKSKTKQ